MNLPGKRRQYSLVKAKAFLADADPVMGRLIQAIGPTSVRSEADLSVYQSLARAIVYQMLSTKSAAAIYARLVDKCDNLVTPASIQRVGAESLREIGFSRAKVTSIMDLTDKVNDGTIPADDQLIRMSDRELIDCLTGIKGIGQWTVEMLLVFNLGRADVFPATDLGIRKGHMMAYSLEEMLPAAKLLATSEQWKPYRTAAAWYLWRATDSVDWNAIENIRENYTQPQGR